MKTICSECGKKVREGQVVKVPEADGHLLELCRACLEAVEDMIEKVLEKRRVA